MARDLLGVSVEGPFDYICGAGFHLFREPYWAAFFRPFAEFLLIAHSTTFVGQAFFLGSFPLFFTGNHHLTKRMCSPPVLSWNITVALSLQGEGCERACGQADVCNILLDHFFGPFRNFLSFADSQVTEATCA